MKLPWSYREKFGRPLAFYTDKASLFQTAEKRKRDDPGVEKDAVEMPPTQIGRALRELGIAWIPAHSAQAKGRVERNFRTAQDRLVKGMRGAGVKTIEEANRYLREDYLVWWERELTVEPANGDDAHRRLEKSHSLGASLSHVETRQVRPDYTLRWDGKLYQIERPAITTGLRRAHVRVEQRLDGSLAVRFGERYLAVKPCLVAEKRNAPPVKPARARRQPASKRGSDWNKNFDLKKGPKIWPATEASGHQRSDPKFPARAPEAPPGQRRPVQGNSPNARKDYPDFEASQESLRRSPIRQLRRPGWNPSGVCTLPVEPRGPHSVRCGRKTKTKTIKTWGRSAASRWPASGPSPRTRRKERAPLIVRDEFRPAIPRAGCSPAEPVSASPALAD
jgi:hypothetical protein